MNDALTCQELVELVTDYIEDALAPTERRRVAGHLAACSGCRVYLDQMRHTIRAAGQIPEESIAPEAKERLLDAFRAWKGREAF